MRIVIVGGGPAGSACALTLDASKRQSLLDSSVQITVIDAGHSDLLSASLWEVPGIPAGTPGPDILGSMHSRLRSTSVDFWQDEVVSILQEEQQFHCTCKSGQSLIADVLVLAGGYKHFSLQGNLELPTRIHPYSPKSRTCLVPDAEHRVAKGIYVAGNLSGEYSMFAIAIGSGTTVACQILSDLAGKPILVHDTVKQH